MADCRVQLVICTSDWSYHVCGLAFPPQISKDKRKAQRSGQSVCTPTERLDVK